jgi:ribose-phosphate pyrophosphokinase
MASPESNAIIFAGESHPRLAKSISQSSGIPLGNMKSFHFPDGETCLEIEESVRGKSAFVVQSIAHRPNEFLMELLIAADALRRASAKEIIAVVPYFGYCRQDRKDTPRVPITAKLVANLLSEAGVTRLIVMDLHAEQVEGFFDIPVDHLHAQSLLVQAVKNDGFAGGIVVGPDLGSIKIARRFSEGLGVEFAVVDKQRVSAHETQALNLIGDVNGKDVLLADDMCSTGGTLVSAAKACREKGAKRILAAISHGLFVGPCVELLEQSPIDVLYVADTIELNEDAKKLKALRSVPVAGLFGQALRCTLSNQSIVSLLKSVIF